MPRPNTRSLCRPDARADEADLPELRANFSIVGFGGQTNSGIALWAFDDWAERDRSQAEIQQDLQARHRAVAGVQAFVFAPPSLPGAGGGLPISS
jgi:multidrug efflux pump